VRGDDFAMEAARYGEAPGVVAAVPAHEADTVPVLEGEHPLPVDLLLVDPDVVVEGLADERGAIGVYRGTRLYCAAEINRRLTAERAPRGYLSPANPCADRGRARHGGRPGVLGLIPCTGVASSITIDMSIR
jgi:hypothetical protein